MLTEMSVMVHGRRRGGLITAGAAQWHDGEFCAGARRGDHGVDHSDTEMDCLLVTGPKARDVLAPLVTGP
jgi:dimethylglycine dehydrogenase